MIRFRAQHTFFPREKGVRAMTITFMLKLGTPPYRRLPSTSVFRVVRGIYFSGFDSVTLLPAAFTWSFSGRFTVHDGRIRNDLLP